MSKTFKDLVEELYEKHRTGLDLEDGNDIFEAIDCWCQLVERDEEDQHRWYTNWRYVYEVPDGDLQRYFAICIPEGKGEDVSWDDLDFQVELDSFYEVFPEQVTTTIYR